MRTLAVALLAIVVSACAAPPTVAPPTASPGGTPTAAPSSVAPPSGTPTAAPPTVAPPTTAPPSGTPTTAPPSGTPTPGEALLALLPASVNGVATTKALLGPTSRTAPRVFLKMIARVGKKPPDALLALAFGSGTTVYAMQIVGTSGTEIVQAFLEERTGAAPGSSAPPTVSIGGKQVTRLGSLVGTFLFASGETFFYVEAPSEPTAADVLGQLP